MKEKNKVKSFIIPTLATWEDDNRRDVGATPSWRWRRKTREEEEVEEE